MIYNMRLLNKSFIEIGLLEMLMKIIQRFNLLMDIVSKVAQSHPKWIELDF